jgi:hypothetical protein
MLASLIGLESTFTERIRAYWHRLKDRRGFAMASAAQEREAVEQGVATVHAPLVGKVTVVV